MVRESRPAVTAKLAAQVQLYEGLFEEAATPEFPERAKARL
jgi:hypothetical protein